MYVADMSMDEARAWLKALQAAEAVATTSREREQNRWDQQDLCEHIAALEAGEQPQTSCGGSAGPL